MKKAVIDDTMSVTAFLCFIKVGTFISYAPIPIGIDDFEEIITKEYYYVDKTLLIKDLPDKGGRVNLFTRPRRFGKSLNLSMLKYYFELPSSDMLRLPWGNCNCSGCDRMPANQ